MWWSATILDPDSSRSARPLLVHRAIDGSPGLQSRRVRRSGRAGHAVGVHQRQWTTPRYSAVEIYHVGGQGNPGAPYLTDR